MNFLPNIDTLRADLDLDPDNLMWERHGTFDAVREPWLKLQEGAWTTPFQRLEWAECWTSGVGAQNGEEPVFILGSSRSGAPAILLPLVLKRKGAMRRLDWLGDPANDYNAPLVNEDFCKALDETKVHSVIRAVVCLVPEAGYICLSKMPTVLNGNANPFATGTVVSESDSFHLMQIDGNWADFERRRWSKNTRHRFRQKRNQLTREGSLVLRRMETEAECRATTQTILDWKVAQLRARGSRNPFNKEVTAFLRDVSTKSVAEIWALEFESVVIAGIIGLRRPNGLLIYQIAYDNDYAKQSPGRLIVTDLAQVLVERGDTIVDFGFGDEEYKAGLATASIELRKRLVPITAAGRFACLGESAKTRVVRFAKTSPSITRLYHTLRTVTLPGQPAPL